MYYVDMHDQMEKVNKTFMKAFEDQNPEAIADLFTEDCKIMPNGQYVIVGRKGAMFILLFYYHHPLY